MDTSYTFSDLIKEVLQKTKMPMSSEEIWEKAIDFNLDKKIGPTGKTPWATIGARIYKNIKENQENSVYIQVSKRPTKFTLRDLNPNLVKPEVIIEVIKKEKFHERDLHPLLVHYIFSEPYFNCYAKTIFHEKAKKKIKGFNEWLYPDLVGVYFPFNDYRQETIKLQNFLNVSSIKLFAFEMKIQLSFANLRQSFFQAVSNASWANEGYLVCLRVDEDPDFKNELQRLSNAFGIGIIKLNFEIVSQSEVLFPARSKVTIDWDTANRIAEDSPDFLEFISDLTEDIKLAKIKLKYDKVLNEEELAEHIKKCGINYSLANKYPY